MEDLIANLKNHPFLAVLALVTVLFAGFRIFNAGASPSVAHGANASSVTHNTDGHWKSVQLAHSWEDRVERDPFAVIDIIIPVQSTQLQGDQADRHTDSAGLVSMPMVPDFKLTTIMQGKHTIAVINGRSVVAGMSIDHWIVLDIDEDQVKLERHGLCILLTVSGESHAGVPVE